MTIGDREIAMNSSDMWRWILGAITTAAVALAMFSLSGYINSNTIRIDRLESRLQNVMDAENSASVRQAEIGANQLNVLRRLDGLDSSMGAIMSLLKSERYVQP